MPMMLSLLLMILIEKIEKGAEIVITVSIEQITRIFDVAASAHAVLTMRLSFEGT